MQRVEKLCPKSSRRALLCATRCSLRLVVNYCLESNHRDTENTEVTQRTVLAKDFSGKAE